MPFRRHRLIDLVSRIDTVVVKSQSVHASDLNFQATLLSHLSPVWSLEVIEAE